MFPINEEFSLDSIRDWGGHHWVLHLSLTPPVLQHLDQPSPVPIIDHPHFILDTTNLL